MEPLCVFYFRVEALAYGLPCLLEGGELKSQDPLVFIKGGGGRPLEL